MYEFKYWLKFFNLFVLKLLSNFDLCIADKYNNIILSKVPGYGIEKKNGLVPDNSELGFPDTESLVKSRQGQVQP